MNKPNPTLDTSQNENRIWRGEQLPTGTVTFLFTDIQGSTPLWERAPEKMAAALQIHNAALRQAIEANGGAVFKTVGDALQAAFPTAPQALKAAIEGQQTLQSAPWNELGPLKVRMGLHTGEAKLDPSGDEYAISHTKNRTARVMAAAYGGQILLSQETADLVQRTLPEGVMLKDMGEHHLKGLSIPEHLYQVVALDLVQEFPALETAITYPNNLSVQLTSFIGREKEIEIVCSLLFAHRLVTLTGPGGSGKTRLSLQVAQEVQERFKDGAWFVELAPISNPDLVPQIVATTLGLRELSDRPILETLTAFLQSKQTLVVLDNCEHLIEACARLASALLHACPRLSLLASSRENLGVMGEVVFQVPPMNFPDPKQLLIVESFRDFEAVRLFVDRAQAVLPSFDITGHNAQAISWICQRVDGIPLAIELAAARVNLLSVEQINERLEHNFRLLVSSSRLALPRQQTLQAMIDWSYNLLSEQERILLRRLSVFAGGWRLDAAEAVCSEEGLEASEILDVLSSLVKKSMVIVEFKQDIETRYHLQEVVRQYAREKVSVAGERQVYQGRHLAYFLEFAKQAEQRLFIFNRERLAWIDRLKADLDNLRAAIEWSGSGHADVQSGLRIAVAVSRRFMYSMGLISEPRQWLLSGLEGTRDTFETKFLRAQALGVLGWLALPSDWPASRSWYEESIRLCREVGPIASIELSWALWGLAYITGFGYHEAETARHLAEESVAVARRLGPSPYEQSYLIMALGYKARIFCILFPEEDLLTTQQEAEESLRLVKNIGAEWDSGGGRWVLGKIAERLGKFPQALEHYLAALEGWEAAEDKFGIGNSYRFLSWLFFRQKDYPRALYYSRKCLREWSEVGIQLRMVRGLADFGIFLVHEGSLPGKERLLILAATLFGAAKKVTGDDPIPIFPEEMDDFDQELELLRSQLTDAEFDKGWDEGQSMALEQAVAYALEEYE